MPCERAKDSSAKTATVENLPIQQGARPDPVHLLIDGRTMRGIKTGVVSAQAPTHHHQRDDNIVGMIPAILLDETTMMNVTRPRSRRHRQQ